MAWMMTVTTAEEPMPDLNPYGARAQAHWQTHLPQEYQQIPEQDRTAFFARLGEEIEARVSQRTAELTDQEEPETATGFKARYALLSTLRHTAEQEVLAEMLPAPQDKEDPAGS
jgi:hypothetical protein